MWVKKLIVFSMTVERQCKSTTMASAKKELYNFDEYISPAMTVERRTSPQLWLSAKKEKSTTMTSRATWVTKISQWFFLTVIRDYQVVDEKVHSILHDSREAVQVYNHGFSKQRTLQLRRIQISCHDSWAPNKYDFQRKRKKL